MPIRRKCNKGSRSRRLHGESWQRRRSGWADLVSTSVHVLATLRLRAKRSVFCVPGAFLRVRRQATAACLGGSLRTALEVGEDRVA